MAPDSSPGELSTVLARLHGMFLTEQDATAAVRQLARAIHQVLPSAAGAGVSLFDEAGTRVSAAATDTAVEAADTLQYELGQGPCLSAWATREVQRIDDTAQDTRWAPWQAAAAESGIRSALSAPMVHQDRGLGALKVYATAPGVFRDADVRVLTLLADAAVTLLGSAQSVDAPVRLSASSRTALASRETIGLASGIVMAREHLDADAARSVLLEQARAQGRRVAEIAAEVLDAEQDRWR